MKACIIEKFGSPSVFEIRKIPVPALKPGHILIKTAATSLNPLDTKLRSGLIPAATPDFPAVLHCDVAGTVEAVAEGVEGFSPGDEVYACAGGIKGQCGALAEYFVADADLVAPKPDSLDLVDSAALPLVSITAWEALIDRAKVKPGQRVLVHGGCGGVGHIAVQLAKSAGAEVYTTVSSAKKAEIAKGLGADVTINYREQSVQKYVGKLTGGEGFDVVFDTVGGENLSASFEAARTSGTVVTINARSKQNLALCHAKNLTLHCVLMLIPLLEGVGRAHHGEILREIAGMVDGGKLKPLLDPDVFNLETVGKAHAKLESGRALGKIRIKI